MRLYTRLITFAVIATYAAVMFLTNTHYTLLDDESIIIAVAGQKVVPTLQIFLNGEGQHEHPPLSDLLLHGWLLLTNYSFFALRIFANLFYIAAMIVTACAARRTAGSRAYWITLVLGLVWPFAYQYGRIAGWYCVTMFLLAWITQAYLAVLEDDRRWNWISFGAAGVLLVWTNYFGLVLLAILCVDLVMFHWAFARARIKTVLAAAAAVVVSFLPLVRAAIDCMGRQGDPTAQASIEAALATVGYPLFAIFGSVAIAPWYWELSMVVAAAALLLAVCVWLSPGRRWMVYFAAAFAVLALGNHITIKRVGFLLPWFFLAIGIAAAQGTKRTARLTAGAAAVLVACGVIGIASGQHYATTNLYEPWKQVAETVARDARSGATVVSANPPFFLYLDYELGLERNTERGLGPYLGEAEYRAHGYRILEASELKAGGGALHGRVVLVMGSGTAEGVEAQETLDRALNERCQLEGRYRAAPDPAALWKQRYVKDVPALEYRIAVNWYACP